MLTRLNRFILEMVTYPKMNHRAAEPEFVVSGKTQQKVVVAHSGARDHYQVAMALAEAGQLQELVTDLYWPYDRWAARLIETMVKDGAAALRFRSSTGLASKDVTSCAFTGACALAARRLRTPFDWKRAAIRWSDARIGQRAGRRARNLGAALLSYSYYGYHAFSEAAESTPKILFQLHPHPSSLRTILLNELSVNPQCASSLLQEWELALPESDFQRLKKESCMAQHCIVASSFTRQTLIENGLPGERIHVVPYGIDAERFIPRAPVGNNSGPLKLLFVGTVTQRKGIQYLLRALDQLEHTTAELLVCGRVIDDLNILRSCRARVEVRASVSHHELLEAYRSADVFVLPTLAEGFAHVLLEAMAAGLPILSTTRSAAPDLVEDGVEGYVTEPGNVNQLAERIQWFAEHRRQTAEMGRAAREKAKTFTWPRFRANIVSVVQNVLSVA